MITFKEKEIAHKCIEIALENGADAIRVSLNKSVSDSATLLNGELDKVSHAADRSLFLYLYVSGRYGTFSTNRLDIEELEDVIMKAIDMVKLLGEDSARKLPEKERLESGAQTGQELGLYDKEYDNSDSSSRLAKNSSISIFKSLNTCDTYDIISEECEYTESYDDTYLIDSQGFVGRHTETLYSAFSEITIQDREGNKYSGYWWEQNPFKEKIDYKGISRQALEKATSQIGPKTKRGGKYKMVVDSNISSRLVSPLITALNGASLQQNISFLVDSMGKKVFSEGLTLMDLARTPGKAGSRLFDTEGVATEDGPIIENGVIMKYFINTYFSHKMGVDATIEDISRPHLRPYIKNEDLSSEEKEVSLKDILDFCGSGIYITGFNGGNCNQTTGDFSYGVEGFAFNKGKITHPVREMLITGNIIDLWNNLLASGTDARECSKWQIPTIAFDNVSFSA